MSQDIHSQRILILDFGSQYTQLIARRVREIGVYCEIYAYDMDEQSIRDFAPKAIILSGGPESVTGDDTPRAPQCVFELGVPVLGICYGMQTMAQQLGGEVSTSNLREFGYAQVNLGEYSGLLDGIQDHVAEGGQVSLDVWMSHGDKVSSLPEGFSRMAWTDSCPFAGMADDTRHFYGVQFHPEVTHTLQGGRILERFICEIAGCEKLWTPAGIIEDAIARVRETGRRPDGSAGSLRWRGFQCGCSTSAPCYWRQAGLRVCG